MLSIAFRKPRLPRTIEHLRKMLSLIAWIGLSSVITHAQPYFSTDTPPTCYEVNAHARNGTNDFEGALYTPATPAIGQPGGAKYKMNPTGKPVWNNVGNQYGDVHAFMLSYTPSTGTSVWNIDFNRDGDFLDYKESVSSTAPTLVGKGFQYVNVFGQGNTYGMTLTLTNFTINGVDFGTFVSATNTPFTHLFEETSGLFQDLVITGNFSFSGAGSNERPRLWIQLGESNIAPTCILTSPSNGSVFQTGDTILLKATASDPTGKVVRVEFYDGANKIGEDLTFPYSFAWTNIPSGTRTLRAKAIDNHEAFAYSNPVVITITGDAPPPSSGPRILSPTNNFLFYDPDTIPILAEIIDPQDSLYIMEFFRSDISLGKDSIAPYVNTALLNPAMGNYSIYVKSTDEHGIMSSSSTVNFTVRCIREDINVDGVVNTFDFLLLLSAYGKECVTVCPEDFNDDAVVSAIDFLRILAVFGYSCL